MASGSVKKLTDKPRAKPYRVTWREHANADQQYRFFKLKTQADAHLAKVLAGLNTGTYVNEADGRITFRDYAEAWRKDRIAADGTAVSVEQQLRLHVYPVIGHRPMNAIRTSEIEALVKRMEVTPVATNGNKPLSATTIGVTYGRVVAVFKAAVRDRIIASSPCVDITLPDRKPANTLQVLEPEQVLDLVDAVPHRYRAVIITAAGTGLRPGELFGLTVDRVNFLKRTITVNQQLVRDRTNGGVKLTPKLKTKTSYRDVPMAPTVIDAMAAHLDAYGPHPEMDLVFTSEWGGPIQQFPFSQMFENARLRAGIPEWRWKDDAEPPTPHDLRHFYASMLLRSARSSRNSIRVVQERLGHASAQVTLDTYGHLFSDEEDRTRQAVEDFFSADRQRQKTDLG
jgi:integrase